MPLLYDLGTGLYHAAIRAAAPFSPKARSWVQGRKYLWQRLEAKREALQGCLWMHCASVGEFEQGRPVLEALKAEFPDTPVLLTFFSPSGYEARKDFPLAEHVEYLPSDSARNARRLVALIKPRAVLWVKYEFWYHYLHALHKAAVPTYLVSAIFRREQLFFSWYGGTHRSMLRCFKHIFVQDEASKQLLSGIAIQNTTVSGDSRFDRVTAIVGEHPELPIAQGFRGEGPVLVCGSTWPADEAVLDDALRSFELPLKCIVVPHELDEEGLRRTEDRFPRPLARWSELENAPAQNVQEVLGPEPKATLLVDRMGLLARLYHYGDVAYVGGGFGDGIHSLIEAAAWGIPVIFGPKHSKFAEARGLIECGGGFEVRDAAQLRAILKQLITNADFREQTSLSAKTYVQDRTGATKRVLDVIKQDT